MLDRLIKRKNRYLLLKIDRILKINCKKKTSVKRFSELTVISYVHGRNKGLSNWSEGARFAPKKVESCIAISCYKFCFHC